MALAAAMAPNVSGSSTRGGKKSSVPTTARSSREPVDRGVVRGIEADEQRPAARPGRAIDADARGMPAPLDRPQAGQRLGQEVGAELRGAAAAVRLLGQRQRGSVGPVGRGRGHGRPMIRGAALPSLRERRGPGGSPGLQNRCGSARQGRVGSTPMRSRQPSAESVYRAAMATLDQQKRARLPDSAFAYVSSKGDRRLPINDEAHVRNALARFNQTRFEDEAARDRARKRLLAAAKKYGIVPVGFFAGQLRVQGHQAAAGRLVLELGQVESLEALQEAPPLGASGSDARGLRVVGVARRIPRRGRSAWCPAGGGHGACGHAHRPPRATDDRAGPRSGHASGSRTSEGGHLGGPHGHGESPAPGERGRRCTRCAQPADRAGDLPDVRHRGLDRPPAPARRRLRDTADGGPRHPAQRGATLPVAARSTPAPTSTSPSSRIQERPSRRPWPSSAGCATGRGPMGSRSGSGSGSTTAVRS